MSEDGIAVIRVESPDDPRVEDYRKLTDSSLRRHLETTNGVFMGESWEVIGRALDAGCTPRSFFVLERWRDRAVAAAAPTGAPVYVAPDDVLHGIAGYPVHRGALCAFDRPVLPTIDAVLDDANTIVVLEDIVDHTNVGAIFRSAAAIGADGIIVSSRCADPLYRRSVRVSMGTVFQVPWTRAERWRDLVDILHARGFALIALGLGEGSRDIRTLPVLERSALLFGTEGTGLSRGALASADFLATIPMRNGVDSLNVAAASAVAMWELIRRR